MGISLTIACVTSLVAAQVELTEEVAPEVVTASPDALDQLQQTGVGEPFVHLILDASGSMGTSNGVSVPTDCPYYYEGVTSGTIDTKLIGSFKAADGTIYMSRMDQLKAALTGCKSPDDGLFDAWRDTVTFAVRDFRKNDSTLRAGFDQQDQLEEAVLSLTTGGNTPMAYAFTQATADFDDYFHNGNTSQCGSYHAVMMGDGVGNAGGFFSFLNALLIALQIKDAGACYGTPEGCGAGPFLPHAAGKLVRNDDGSLADALSHVDGVQQIRTHTIAFQAPASADKLLKDMAQEGEGLSYSVESFEGLAQAFFAIVSDIQARPRLNFAGGSVDADGIFSGNMMYIPEFRPSPDGHWFGSVKKYCILPNNGASGCVFVEDANGELLINPTPVDVWTGETESNATVGGSGQAILAKNFGVASAGAAVPDDPFSHRTILTWKHDQPGYVPVHPDHLTLDDTWVSHICQHHELLNAIHGYTREVTDCLAGQYEPLAFDSWPQGANIHSGTVLLKYTQSCEDPGSKCFLVAPANDGMLHVFSAATGRETSALVPAEFWRPNAIAHNTLADRAHQPNAQTRHRYYLDGQIKLHHVDEDGDGLIDEDERAQLIFGLGRGGRGYYMLDVNAFDGVPNDKDNAIRPLFADEKSGYKHLLDTWSAPWTGALDWSGAQREVAVFPSGHVNELDVPETELGELVLTGPSVTEALSLDCADVGISQSFCGNYNYDFLCSGLGLTCTPDADCSVCDSPATCAGSPPCYDWSGWSLLYDDAEALAWGGPWVWESAIDSTSAPVSYSDPNATVLGYQLVFDWDMQVGDSVSLINGEGTEVWRLEGTGTATTVTSPWIRESFSINIQTDGLNTSASQGYQITEVRVEVDQAEVASGPLEPSLYVVDLDRWNQGETVRPPFSQEDLTDKGLFAGPRGEDPTQANGLLLRFTADCADEEPGSNEECIDANSSALTSDLKYMTCPISAEPSVLTEGGLLSAVYIGDECGQIWKIGLNAVNDTWSVQRLLRLNQSVSDADAATQTGFPSKDYRKIFRKLDLVLSTCNGERAVGVYFGSGNVQRPAAEDSLLSPPVTGGEDNLVYTDRNVVGVVWDTPNLPNNADLGTLVNVTTDPRTNPAVLASRFGWFIELDAQERMLRDPLVFEGLAYFDIFRPAAGASASCSALQGQARTMVMDNCSALGYQALSDPTTLTTITPMEQRSVATRTNSVIGPGFTFVSPRDGEAFVSLGAGAEGKARLAGRDLRETQIFYWRL